MNNSVFILDVPILDDEAAANIQKFLYAVVDAFDTHYCKQIERYYREYQDCISNTAAERNGDNTF